MKLNSLLISTIFMIGSINSYSQQSNQTVNNPQKTTTMSKIEFKFPDLPYAYDALEPYIDKQTMEIHYSKHHKAYFDNFVNAAKGTEVESQSLETTFANISKYAPAIRNNGGGLYNHTLFWNNLSPKGGGVPTGALADDINKTFGSLDEFKKLFGDAAKTRFGSGWAWLVVTPDKKLKLSSTPNQDNPLMDIADVKGTPILALDVWEHAYYLKYQNRRPDYIENWWNVVNWTEVTNRYNNALK